MTDTNNNRTSLCSKSDYAIRTSVLSRVSQLNPMTAASGPSISLPRITNRLSSIPISNEEQKQLTQSNNPREITVELNDTYRQQKLSDRSPVVSYCSLVRKPTEVLYI
jgi:hypothetical protein